MIIKIIFIIINAKNFLELLRKVQQKRVLGKEKLDRIISNIKKITQDHETVNFVKIVNSSKSKTKIIEKFDKNRKIKFR